MKGNVTFESKNFFFLIPVAIGLLIITLAFKLSLPQISDLQNNRALLAVKEKDLAALAQKAGELERLDKQDLAAKFRTLDTTLPSQKNVFGALSSLYFAAGESSVNLKSFELAPGLISTPSASVSAAASDLSFLSFKAQIEGDIQNIKKFFEKINTTNPLFAVTKMTSSSNDGKTYDAELELAVYWQPLPTVLGKISDPLPMMSSSEEKVLEKISQFPSNSFDLFSLPEQATSTTRSRTSPFD